MHCPAFVRGAIPASLNVTANVPLIPTSAPVPFTIGTGAVPLAQNEQLVV